MAEITIKIVSTGEEIPISEISLDLVTGEELIQELIANEFLGPVLSCHKKDVTGHKVIME